MRVHRTAPMEQITIKIIRLETTQTSFASLDRALSRRIVWVNFAYEKHLAAPAFDDFADYFFGSAFTIHLRGIDESHS